MRRRAVMVASVCLQGLEDDVSALLSHREDGTE